MSLYFFSDDKEISDFFYQSVEMLCCTSDFKSALERFWPFLRARVPVIQMNLGRSNFDTNVMDAMAVCSDNGVTLQPERYSHTQEQVRMHYDGSISTADDPMGAFIIDKGDPSAAFFQYFPKKEYRIEPPFFFLRTTSGGVIRGAAIFCCQQDNLFTPRHLDFLRALRMPILIAFQNYFHYQELAELKDMIWQENLHLRQQLSGTRKVEIIGANGGLAQVMERVRLTAPVDVPVLITGETGTGKELFAKAIHEFSPRADNPFVAVNCGAIPTSLIDSELFGHLKGAFTGASQNHKGRFERANGGTIFLDEIGELPLEVQARLLRVLQERTIERVGGTYATPVDFRLVAATNRNLEAMVREGSFREDLYYRLNVVSLRIPPLRERKKDLPVLVEHFIKRSATRFGIIPPILPPAELLKLYEYPWPGNVRELQNMVEEALVLSAGGPLHFSPNEKPSIGPSAPVLSMSFDAAQRHYFMQILKSCNGRIAGKGGAAEKAGMNPNTLRSKLQKLGVPYGVHGG